MSAHIRAAVHGLGNIGRRAVECLETAVDMECVGVVRSAASVGTKKAELRGVPDFPSLDALAARCGGLPDVVLICGPSRNAPDDAERYLRAGVHTVDSFDIHTEIPAVLARLEPVAVAAGKSCIISAGWDPGSDSVLRALFEAMAPVGTTFTNFGRGRSMGHSVAARGIPGVADAISVTIPTGGGKHARLVYILPKDGADTGDIAKNLKADPYFRHDPLDVRFVATQAELDGSVDSSHGVLLERTGASGMTSNQKLAFDMRIDNPSLTAQMLVSAARAATRLSPGCRTLIDVPPVAMLPGDRLKNIARLV